MELQHPKATVVNPATWFTGDVYLTPIYAGTGPSHMSVGLVRFPRAPTRTGTATPSARPCT